jgi:cysteine-rich repeat protein
VTTTFCGNARIDAQETCDDWNNYPGDGCSAACLIEVGWHCPVIGLPCAPICGDGRVVGAEGCDDGNTVAGDGCNELCQREPTPALCGDGTREGSEECDFGISNNDQTYIGCSTSCRWLACGDGVVNGPEECDLGVAQNRARYANTGGCTPLCTFPHFCGDGHPDVENGEQCDLGPSNGLVGHPCTTSCKVCLDCF